MKDYLGFDLSDVEDQSDFLFWRARCQELLDLNSELCSQLESQQARYSRLLSVSLRAIRK